MLSTVQQVTMADLIELMDGKINIATANAVNLAANKITNKVGSTDLRKYVESLRGLTRHRFTTKQYDNIAKEVNYLNRNNIVIKNFDVSKGLHSIMDKIKLVFNFNKGAKSVLRNGLEIDASVWAATILHYVRMNGNADVKRCVTKESDVLLYLQLEGGLNKDGTVNVALTNGYGYCGPLQLGPAAWYEGPRLFTIPKYKHWKQDAIGSAHRAEMVAATKAYAASGPGDLKVMGPGIVEFWNACWNQFNAHAKRNSVAAKLAPYVPRSVEMMYAMHNAGAYAAMTRLLIKRVSPISNNQSRPAVAVGKVVKDQFNANMA